MKPLGAVVAVLLAVGLRVGRENPNEILFPQDMLVLQSEHFPSTHACVESDDKAVNHHWFGTGGLE